MSFSRKGLEYDTPPRIQWTHFASITLVWAYSLILNEARQNFSYQLQPTETYPPYVHAVNMANSLVGLSDFRIDDLINEPPWALFEMDLPL